MLRLQKGEISMCISLRDINGSDIVGGCWCVCLSLVFLLLCSDVFSSMPAPSPVISPVIGMTSLPDLSSSSDSDDNEKGASVHFIYIYM